MSNEAGKLVIVPTPIGNLGDITLRALDALRDCDVIYAEDTRVTSKLLSCYDIAGKRVSRLDENSMRDHLDEVARAVESGNVVAYCSDAGMPGVSDPGMLLVSHLRERGLPVEVLPGASAVATAYVASGTSAQRFCFIGFPPRKASEREALLRSFSDLDAALVLYESPNRVIQTLESIAAVFPNREVAVARELTKMHEEVVRGSASEMLGQFSERAALLDGIRGEIAIVIDALSDEEIEQARDSAVSDATSTCEVLRDAGLSGKTLAKAIQQICGIPRNVAYDLAMGKGNDAAIDETSDGIG